MVDCTFCRIIAKQMPGEIIYEDEEVVAFKDINPQAPVHFLVVPRKHIASVLDIQPEDERLIGRLLLVAKKLTNEIGISTKGFRLVINTGDNAGQNIYHIHIHVLGGRRMTWPPG
ncbi:MAG TPA: histidine triad nucleotide-binding protein [Deltaproteobacteria bacterium]|nr:MAG: histidine triad nucleotide-binding protein [candidate division KSB1 bacterium 4484_219]RKY78786.1 MAG: histidine triad nucleotide-binding protein [candidate division KSB1 bacterium]RKY80187.1 MAG: histidine triad nucleotide-binding protein [candidate division KSB1 bacterium]RKY89300.1 MAG: histidine triad nucleotide-binding protein [candidate division KSB1 bacterium]HEC31547.1 histidine triad nucleotide-binding protein [Deltaproteobacteria bacterium]